MQGYDFFVMGVCGGFGATIGYFIASIVLQLGVNGTEKLIDYLERKGIEKEEENIKEMPACPHCGFDCQRWIVYGESCGKVNR